MNEPLSDEDWGEIPWLPEEAPELSEELEHPMLSEELEHPVLNEEPVHPVHNEEPVQPELSEEPTLPVLIEETAAVNYKLLITLLTKSHDPRSRAS